MNLLPLFLLLLLIALTSPEVKFDVAVAFVSVSGDGEMFGNGDVADDGEGIGGFLFINLE